MWMISMCLTMVVEPGKAITEFEVSEPLETGEYTIHMNIATLFHGRQKCPAEWRRCQG